MKRDFQEVRRVRDIKRNAYGLAGMGLGGLGSGSGLSVERMKEVEGKKLETRVTLRVWGVCVCVCCCAYCRSIQYM